MNELNFLPTQSTADHLMEELGRIQLETEDGARDATEHIRHLNGVVNDLLSGIKSNEAQLIRLSRLMIDHMEESAELASSATLLPSINRLIIEVMGQAHPSFYSVKHDLVTIVGEEDVEYIANDTKSEYIPDNILGILRRINDQVPQKAGSKPSDAPKIQLIEIWNDPAITRSRFIEILWEYCKDQSIDLI